MDHLQKMKEVFEVPNINMLAKTGVAIVRE